MPQIEVHYYPSYHEACENFGIKNGYEIPGVKYHNHHRMPKTTLFNQDGSKALNHEFFGYEFQATITTYDDAGNVEEAFEGWCQQGKVLIQLC